MMTVTHKNGELYGIIDNWDVWGNAEDGYEVNECIDTCHSLLITDDWDAQTVYDAMVDIGILGGCAVLNETIFISNTGNGWEIEGKDGLPLYSIIPRGPDFT